MTNTAKAPRTAAKTIALATTAALALNAAAPAFASDVSIKFTVNKVIEDSVVAASGQIRNRISSVGDITMNGTRMSADALNDRVYLYMLSRGRVCDAPSSIHVADPTFAAGAPNLFKHYGWEPVSKVLRPVRSHLVSADSKPITVFSDHQRNDRDKPVTVTGQLTDTVTNSISWNWSRNATAGAEQTFKYEKSFGFFGELEAETKVSISGTVGEGGEETMSDTVVQSANMSTVLDPGEEVAFVMSASRGKIVAEVTYEESYTGNLLVNYGGKCDGHHHWRVPIMSVLNLDSVTLPFIGALEIESFEPRTLTERLELDYYTNISGRAVDL